MPHNSITDRQEIDLIKGIWDLTLKEDADTQNLIGALAPLLDVPEKKGKVEDEGSDSLAKPPYKMTNRKSSCRKKRRNMESTWVPLDMKGMTLI